MKYSKYLVAMLLFIGVAGHSQTTELKLASDIWPPFTNMPTKISFAMEIVDSALRRINIDVDYNILEFGEVIDGIIEGDFDGSAALWHTPEREVMMVFSEPYLQNQLVLVGKKGADVTAVSFKDLKDVNIGVVKNYAYGEELTKAGNFTLVSGESDQQNLEKLLSGKLDYILVDAILIQYLLKFQVNDVSELLSIGKTPILTKALHFAVSYEVLDAENIIERFNAEIDKMIKDGTYNAILGLNWIEADVDGDGKMEFVLQGERAGQAAPENVYSIYVTGPPKKTNRYYIDGETYDGWNNIPDRYKKDAMRGSGPDPNKVGFKL
jgi:ABC-type amino acid transport substrate-binding protein